MKILKAIARKKKEKKQDFYQETLEKFGRAQLKIIAERGLNIKIFAV